MMNSRITKIIANTIGLGAMAALAITVYQLGTNPSDEAKPPENSVDMVQKEEEKLMVDAGTSRVKAELETPETEEKQEETKESEDAETETENTEELPETGAEKVSAAALSLPEINFSEDTLMEWPVNGNILVDYSMDQTTYFPTLDQYKLSSAIAVQSVEGAPVMAAVNGTVYSVEENAQTGTTVTMELGNGYQAVYGQLTDLCVGEGDTVKKGEIIGYVNAPTKYYSLEGSNLYFAMKKNGEPIDPIAYLP